MPRSETGIHRCMRLTHWQPQPCIPRSSNAIRVYMPSPLKLLSTRVRGLQGRCMQQAGTALLLPPNSPFLNTALLPSDIV